MLVGAFKEPVGAFFRHEGECSVNILTSAAAPAGAAVDAVCVLAGVGRQRSVHSLQLRVTGRRAVLQQFYILNSISVGKVKIFFQNSSSSGGGGTCVSMVLDSAQLRSLWRPPRRRETRIQEPGAGRLGSSSPRP